jgi:predicted phosphohydrolase
MKIFPHSDHHLHKTFITQNKNCDLHVLAGDITNNKKELYFHILALMKRVVFVAGNHDYDNNSFKTYISDIKEMFKEKDKIYILDKDYVIIDGIKFIGCTLWNPNTEINTNMNFKEIYQEELNYIMRESSNYDGEVIIVTHYKPALKTTINENSELLIEDFIKLTTKIKYWFYGHLHIFESFEVGETKFICNPKGLPSETTNFKKDLLIEI